MLVLLLGLTQAVALDAFEVALAWRQHRQKFGCLSMVAEVPLDLKNEVVAIMRLHSRKLERWTAFHRSVPDRLPVLGFR